MLMRWLSLESLWLLLRQIGDYWCGRGIIILVARVDRVFRVVGLLVCICRFIQAYHNILLFLLFRLFILVVLFFVNLILWMRRHCN